MSEQRTEKTHPLHGLEPKQPGQQRCECGSAYYDGAQWVTRYLCDSTEPEDPKEIIVPVAHCPGSCGCRLSVVDGEPRVGEKYADLERDAKRFRAVAANVDAAAAYAYLQIGEHALRSSLRVRQEGIFEGLRKAVAIIQLERELEAEDAD